MIWHWKLGTSMYRVQEMMTENKPTDKLEVSTVIPPFIVPKFRSTPNFPVPKCAACQIACAMNQNPGVIKQAAISEKEEIMSWDKYEVGYFFSADKLIFKILAVFQVDIAVRDHTFVFMA